MSRKITIIGGSEFIGTSLCRQLELKQKDFEIIGIKMSKQFLEKCKIADVRNVETLRATITGDIVVNLAAIHRDDVRDMDKYEKTNVGGAENITQICKEKNICKIVLINQTIIA